MVDEAEVAVADRVDPAAKVDQVVRAGQAAKARARESAAEAVAPGAIGRRSEKIQV